MAKNYLAVSFGLIGLLGYATAQASCGSTACSINTNWDEHGMSHPGWTADLRYSFSRADQLRSGSNKTTISPTDPAYTGTEVENLRTINKIVTAMIDYTHDDHWGMMINLPYVMRDHAHTIGATTSPFSTESFTASALGDIKVVGRYRWALDETGHSGMGVKFGLKLNTAKKDFVLSSGVVPNEVTLQPGNGSTDLILGLFWQQAASGNDWNWFAQGTVQNSIRSGATFRPGNQINLDGGARYTFSHNLSGLLQFNAQRSSTDSGSTAALSPVTGGPSSGGKIFSFTHGLSYAFTSGTQLYGLVQLPIYQYVNGEQLTANSSITIGVSQRF